MDPFVSGPAKGPTQYPSSLSGPIGNDRLTAAVATFLGPSGRRPAPEGALGGLPSLLLDNLRSGLMGETTLANIGRLESRDARTGLPQLGPSLPQKSQPYLES